MAHQPHPSLSPMEVKTDCWEGNWVCEELSWVGQAGSKEAGGPGWLWAETQVLPALFPPDQKSSPFFLSA